MISLFSLKQLARFGWVLSLVVGAMLLSAGLAWAAALANDSAANTAYSDGWQSGDNGGSGFGGGWTLSTSGSAGHFTGSSTGNGAATDTNSDGDINTSGRAWGLYANNSGQADAVRPFNGAVRPGDQLTLRMDNGYVYNTPNPPPTGVVGFSLWNASNQSVFEIYFRGGDANYTFNDNAGASATGPAYTDEGVAITFTLVTSNTYQAIITRLVNGATVTRTGTLINAANGRTITQLRLFNYTAGSGSAYDLFFNSLSVAPAQCWATPDNGTTVYGSIDASAVRNALGAVSAGGTVKMTGYCPGAVSDSGSTQVALITKTVTLAGGYTATNWTTYNPTGNPTTLDALGNGRVLSTTNVAVTLQGFTITNGYINSTINQYGGGIYAAGALTLTDMTVYSSTITGTAGTQYGGGAYVTGAALLTNTVLTQNRAQGYGGGLYGAATAALKDVTFISNSTLIGYGGGAYVATGVTATGGRFENNRAPGTTGTGIGGGLFSLASAGSVTILTGTQFLSNTAYRNAGGLWANNGGTTILSNTVFLSNTATTGNGGGALLGNTNLTGTQFIGNTASGSGGGAYFNSTANVTGTTFISNTANGNGGGALAVGAATLNGGLFQNNRSTTSNGGGLYVTSTLSLTGTQFISNTALNGGGAYFAASARITATQFTSNTASNTGGGLYGIDVTLWDVDFISNTAPFGGGAYVWSGGGLTVTNGKFERNSAVPNNGGGLFSLSPVTLTGTKFFSNTAVGNAGGLLVNTVAASLSNTVFLNNSAAGVGGGARFNGTAYLTATQFISNSALDGGGAYVAGPGTLNGALFQNNQCTGSGCLSGGWYAASALTLAQVVSTTDNIQNQGLTTQAAGGVIWFNGSASQTITGTGSTTFNNMEVNNTGAGVYLGQNLTVTNRLTLTTDLTTTQNYTLNLTANAVSSGPGDVWGQTYRNHSFTTDTPYSFGNPNVAVTFGTTSTVPGSVLVQLAHGLPQGFPTAVSRAYTITATGGGAFSATLRLHYQDGEVPAGNESNLRLWRYTGAAWTSQGRAAYDTTGNWVEQSAVTAFSPWAVSGSSPLAVVLATFTATPAGDHNRVAWETVSELHNLGFNLWRGTTPAAPTEKLNTFVIPSQSPGGTGGFAYTYDDYAITSGVTYYYWLEDIDLNGKVTRHGPVSTASGEMPTAVTLVSFNGRDSLPAWPLPGLGAMLLMGGALVIRRRRIRA